FGHARTGTGAAVHRRRVGVFDQARRGEGEFGPRPRQSPSRRCERPAWATVRTAVPPAPRCTGADGQTRHGRERGATAMRTLGIDVGIAGAFVLMVDGTVIAVADMPVVIVRKKHRVDPAQAAALIASWTRIDHAVLELVNAMPSQDVTGMFGFGSTGIILGILAALVIPYTEVAPASWKRQLQVPADKGGSRFRASQLLPGAVQHWPLIKHHARAEAALLALLGERLLNGGGQ